MKILYIANRAEVFSGGQISLLELISGLDKSRYVPTVLCPGEGELVERSKERGASVKIWEMPSAKTFNLSRLNRKARELKNIIKESGADIVHTNGIRAQFYASIALRGSNIPLIWHVRESKRDVFLYDCFLARASARIICVSHEASRKRFRGHPGINKKINVIYNGVDTDHFVKDQLSRRTMREKYALSDDNIFLGIIGLLEELKGHRILLKALKLVLSDHGNVRLLILGKVIDKEYFESLVAMVKDMGLGEYVIFSDPKPYDSINGVLSALDIFTLPSYREGFSRMLIEAMSCSLPVIASDVGGNKEAVVNGESGILVPYGDDSSLAEAIVCFIEKSEESIIAGKNARKRVKELFSIERHVQQVQDIYEEVYSGV